MRQAARQAGEIDVVPSFKTLRAVTGADQFGPHAALFDFRLWDGETHLGRLGHRHRGAYASSGYIFAAHQLDGDATTHVAGISIEPYRAGITTIELK